MIEKKDVQKTHRSTSLWVNILIWIGILALLGLLAYSLLSKASLISIGDEIPDFSFTTFEGFEYEGSAKFSLSQLRGKVVLINFWASWCKPCEGEAADLEQAWRHYQPEGKVVFLGVDYVDTEPEARAYLAKFDISFPNGPDLGTRISQIFSRNLGVPETYILDENGILQFIKIGPFLSLDAIITAIESVESGD